ncbi:MAG: UDP-N-acetyl-D-mannosamine transferase [Treponema sp. CETP13]|nr:MAG: UDP-N-acetyl-D-mannosamine transferase [Treponema sp. CETP13]
MEIERINVLKVPVDVIKPECVEKKLFSLLNEPGTKQIVFLSIWDLLKARRNPEYLKCLESASLVLPISKSILFGARFLKKTEPVRYNPFSTVVSLFTSLETRYRSLYLLGGHKGSLMEAERNLHATFPGLHIVGRYVGYYPKAVEKDILSAIFKANPSMVLLGDGIHGGIKWAYERRNNFGSSIFVYYKKSLDIFSKRSQKVSKKTFDRGNEKWVEILHNPLRVFLVFPYISYLLMLIVYKIFRRH